MKNTIIEYFKKRNRFTCPKCKHQFKISRFWKWVNAPHWFDIWRWVTCPKCGHKGWAKVIK